MRVDINDETCLRKENYAKYSVLGEWSNFNKSKAYSKETLKLSRIYIKSFFESNDVWQIYSSNLTTQSFFILFPVDLVHQVYSH